MGERATCPPVSLRSTPAPLSPPKTYEALVVENQTRTQAQKHKSTPLGDSAKEVASGTCKHVQTVSICACAISTSQPTVAQCGVGEECESDPKAQQLVVAAEDFVARAIQM